MAPPVLLTLEQAQRNHEVFMRVAAKLPRAPSAKAILPRRLVTFSGTSTSLGTPLGSAAADVNTHAHYPPPPDVTTWQDPKYHDQIISTFFSTAQSQVGYVPNKVRADPQAQIDGFNSFIAELENYGSYLSLVDSKKNKYTHASTECGPLLDAATDFINMVGDALGAANIQKMSADLVRMIQDAVKAMGSSSSETVESTQYSFYTVAGNVVGVPYPVGIILYSYVDMERHTSGKSTVGNQTIEMYSYGYMINSPVVTENAKALSEGATIVPSKEYAANINQSLPH